ncbi:26S proteasome non-ATPase regulatory subunit 4 homolog [Rutidosis leptorrhynchoides]
MGTLEKTATLETTSDFDEIRTHLRCIRALRGGELDFFEVFNSCADKLDHYPSNPKRFLFFTGGPIDFEMGEAHWYGNKFKEQGVANDVVNFFLDERFANCKMDLDAFVACTDNNNNSLIKHVPADSRTRVRDIISSLVERKKGNNEAEELLS